MRSFFAVLSLLTLTSAYAQMPDIQWSGDFRYRHETIDDGDAIGNKDTRQRIRGRLAAKSEVTKDVNASIRIATGTGSVTSTNQTLGDGGSNKSLEVDIFSVNWKFFPKANITLGKMKNPFYTVGSSDMVFDSDVTPEGISVSYQSDLFFASLNQFWIADNTTSTDVMLYAPQIGTHFNAGPLKIVIGGSWFNYSSMVNQSLSGSLKAAGNTTGAGFYVNGYKVLNAFSEISGQAGHVDYSVFFDYIKNSEVKMQNTGWLAGAKLKLHDWSMTYDYRWVEADATVAFLADGDTAGSLGTALYGHRTDLAYAFNKNISTSAVYYAHTKMSNKKHYDKYQLNLVFKF